MRLHRPHIPISVRAEVAERQLCAAGDFGKVSVAMHYDLPSGKRLANALRLLFGDHPCELHHRPGLLNRHRYVRNGKTFYDPLANDPDHLVYLAVDDHDIETRVRGQGAQRSDLGQARYNKRVAKNREKIKVRPIRAKIVVGMTVSAPGFRKGRIVAMGRGRAWPKGRKLRGSRA